MIENIIVTYVLPLIAGIFFGFFFNKGKSRLKNENEILKTKLKLVTEKYNETLDIKKTIANDSNTDRNIREQWMREHGAITKDE